MNAFRIGSMVFGGVAVLTALAAAVAITAVSRFRSRDAAVVLAVVSVFGGVLVSSIATPDWSPVSMGALYAPFLLVGIYSAAIAALRGRSGAVPRG